MQGLMGQEALSLRDKFSYEDISNMTGISKRTLYRANNKLQEH